VLLGRLAFDKAIQLDNSVASAYVLMANIYATAGMQEDAEKIEDVMKKLGT
jgi:Tfp pilus assembly protein PilF